jgi:membrane protein YdbS with pleckstrin-like domain
MDALGSRSIKLWRGLFLTLETLVLGVLLFCGLAERFWGLHVEPQSEWLAIVLGILICLAWLFLLIVSPFFLKSLRWIALLGWIIAFGGLLFGLLMPAH